MMKKYELVFSAIESGHFLVADLLPEEQPPEVETLETKSLLRFKYSYSFLSTKIISRFIVRTNQIIKDNLYWRRGVVLESSNNYAIVRADLEEKEIILYIGGMQTTCRDFLSQLRGVLGSVHREIANLDIEEFVSPVGYPATFIKYQDLIVAESVGELYFFVPELKRRVLVSDLLNGFENPENRIKTQRDGLQKSYKSMIKIFISHSSKDKDFARQIAHKLRNEKIDVWIDENEIYVGDSLIQKISQGIAESDCIIFILSPDSVDSNWVKEEYNAMMLQQILANKNKVLPLLYKDCDIPILLRDKLYADFRDPFKYETEFNKLLDGISLVKSSLA